MQDLFWHYVMSAVRTICPRSSFPFYLPTTFWTFMFRNCLYVFTKKSSCPFYILARYITWQRLVIHWQDSQLSGPVVVVVYHVTNLGNWHTHMKTFDLVTLVGCVFYALNGVFDKRYCMPRSSDSIYIVTYYIKWVTASWTDGTKYLEKDRTSNILSYQDHRI